MRFDPIKKEVYSDQGEFIKKMNCPYKLNWVSLEATNTRFRNCSNCDRLVVDTKFLSDDELQNMVKQNPNTCLKIDLNQNNLKIIINDGGRK